MQNNKDNFIILDFGTATTFDIIKSKGVYDGGVIAPGIKLSIENLYSSTALLPPFKFKKYPKSYGKNTIEAMSSGFYWGYIGLIKNILHKIKSELNYKMLVLATGGLSDLFINEVSEDIMVNKDLTITGLFFAYEEGKY